MKTKTQTDNNKTLFSEASLIGEASLHTVFLSCSRHSEPFTRSISETEENPVALAVCTSKPVGLKPFFFLKNGYSQLDYDHPSSCNKLQSK